VFWWVKLTEQNSSKICQTDLRLSSNDGAPTEFHDTDSSNQRFERALRQAMLLNNQIECHTSFTLI